MRALAFVGPRSSAIVELPPPRPAEGEALVAPKYVGLCGTDLELFTGCMPYFAEDNASYPIQPGHEVTGVVVESGDGSLAPGTAVLIDPVFGCGRCAACESGFQTRCPDRRELGLRRGMPGGACERLAVPAINLHPIPDGVSVRDAVLVEPGVTALNGVERLGDVAGQEAVVIGAGTVGLIAAQLLLSRGADVAVVVVDQTREPLVEQLGLRPVARVEGGRYPVVFEAAGTAGAIHAALEAVAPGGRIAIAGVQPAAVNVDVNALVLKDATAFGVLNGPGLYRRMLAELATAAVDAAALIDGEFELGSAQDALVALEAHDRLAPKVILSIKTHPERARSVRTPR